MGKGRGFLWFICVCVLGLGFSRTTASLTRMMGQSVLAYFLLTASLIIATLLFIYLPGKLLAGKFKSGGKINTGRGHGSHSGPQCRNRITLKRCMFLALLLGMLVCARIFLAPDMGSLAERGQIFMFNLFFQLLGSFFLYFGIFALAGGVCASAALLSIICLPVYHNSVYMAEPQSLLLGLFGFGVWICALCIRRIERRNGGRALSVLPGILAGAVCGALGCAHLALCSLFLLFAQSVFAFRKKAGFFRLLATFFLTFLCSFFLILWLDGLKNGLYLGEVLQRWVAAGFSREYDAILHSPALSDWWLTVPVYLLAFLSVFGVLERDADVGTAWILPLAFVVLVELYGDAPLQEQGLRFVLLGVFAGYGILQTTSVSAVALGTGGLNSAEDAAGSGGSEMVEREDVKKMDASDSESALNGGRPKPGTWLENPLPVPKRHVKKELEYGFEPDPDQMFFDIPVSELDDFDI